MKTAAHEGQLMLSIGALLASEREKRGIPLEKAAKETRMRPQRLRDIEGDDLSHFTNPSYARMFIIAYAKYLGIPMKTIRDHLPDRGESGTEGYQYISTSTENLPSLRHDIASKPARSNTALYVLAASFVVLVVAVLGGITYVVVNADRFKTVDTAKAVVDPTPAPKPVVVTTVVSEKSVVLENLRPTGEKSVAFDGLMSIAVTPIPEPMIVRKPEPAVDPVEDDHAFLLGASPDQKPAPVQ